MTSERLPRSWRLARGTDIRATMRTGCRARLAKLDISWRSNEKGHPRVGLVVPRHGTSAVSRNRLRRRLREIVRRRLLPRLMPVDLVVRARPDAYAATFSELAADLEQWLLSLSD